MNRLRDTMNRVTTVLAVSAEIRRTATVAALVAVVVFVALLMGAVGFIGSAVAASATRRAVVLNPRGGPAVSAGGAPRCGAHTRRWSLTAAQLRRLAAPTRLTNVLNTRLNMSVSSEESDETFQAPPDYNDQTAERVRAFYFGGDFHLCGISGVERNGTPFSYAPSAPPSNPSVPQDVSFARLFPLPDQVPEKLVMSYDRDRPQRGARSAGSSCARPLESIYVPGASGEEEHTHNTVAAHLHRSYMADRERHVYSLSFSWQTSPGYRLCDVVIAPEGLPVYHSHARSGTFVAQQQPLYPGGTGTIVGPLKRVLYAYVTAAKR